MATITAHVQTPLEVYLHTWYHPDVDWIDGEIRERKLGQFAHANLRAILLIQLAAQARTWGVRVLPEQRLKVSDRRYRVPDLLIVPLKWRNRADRFNTVWVFDPVRQRVWKIGSRGDWIVTPERLKTGPVELNVPEIFRLAAE